MIKGCTYVAHMAHECHRIEVAQRAEASAARAKAAREAREAEAAAQSDGPPNTPQPPLPDASPTPSSPLLDPSVTLASAMEAIENSVMDQPPDEGDWGPLHDGPGLQDLINLWPDDIPPSLKTCPLVGDLVTGRSPLGPTRASFRPRSSRSPTTLTYASLWRSDFTVQERTDPYAKRGKGL